MAQRLTAQADTRMVTSSNLTATNFTFHFGKKTACSPPLAEKRFPSKLKMRLVAVKSELETIRVLPCAVARCAIGPADRKCCPR